MAIYPNNILNWTPRIDDVNIVFANDPNTLASEISAIETYVGTTPQIEGHPPVPNHPVTFSTMSSRLSAAQGNELMPYCSLSNVNGQFIVQGTQFFNSYGVAQDPYGMWNGKDITIQSKGWWLLTASQKWNQHGNNFRGGNVLFFYLNGTWVDADIWNWNDFFGDTTFTYANNVFNSNGYSRLVWTGMLNAGDRIQVLSANSTFCPGIQITNMTLKAVCLINLPNSSFSSG